MGLCLFDDGRLAINDVDAVSLESSSLYFSTLQGVYTFRGSRGLERLDSIRFRFFFAQASECDMVEKKMGSTC